MAGLFFGNRIMAADSDDNIKKALKANAIILDVRTPAEFAEKNFPASLNIPVDELEKRINELGDKNKLILVYCRSGRRSAIAKKTLNDKGYINVVDAGGLDDLIRLSGKGK